AVQSCVHSESLDLARLRGVKSGSCRRWLSEFFHAALQPPFKRENTLALTLLHHCSPGNQHCPFTTTAFQFHPCGPQPRQQVAAVTKTLLFFWSGSRRMGYVFHR